MKKVLLIFISIFLSIFSVAYAETKVVMKNSLQYESSLAALAVAHKDICSIKYGKADTNVGGYDEDPKHMGGGSPSAFIPVSDGSFWVLDSINKKVKHFGSNGKLISVFDLPGNSSNKTCNFKDMAILPKGGFYLYNSIQGIVFRVDKKGKSKVQIEGLPSSSEIGVDSKGNLLIANPIMQSLLRFKPTGELIEKYDGQTFLSTVVDASDKPLGIKFNDLEAELFRAENASPTAFISLAKFPLTTPKERKAHYVTAEILGSDAKKNIYVLLIACDKAGVIHQYRVFRLNNSGKILAKADLLAVPFIHPRRKRPTPDGKIFGFRSDKKSWFPITYSLP